MGAVAGTPSKKGVFITTSDFTKGAIGYGLGLQTEITFKVMKMDSDYWDSMEDL